MRHDNPPPRNLWLLCRLLKLYLRLRRPPQQRPFLILAVTDRPQSESLPTRGQWLYGIYLA